MANFAELNVDNKVIRVCVVDDMHVPNDMHPDGVAWCENFWGGIWVQTSYNNNFRKQYAGIGYEYHTGRNNFIPPQPFDSWALDVNDDWQPPKAKPDDDKNYQWNENIPDWVEQP